LKIGQPVLVYREKAGKSEWPFTIREIADKQISITDENGKIATFNISQITPYILPSDQSFLEDISNLMKGFAADECEFDINLRQLKLLTRDIHRRKQTALVKKKLRVYATEKHGKSLHVAMYPKMQIFSVADL
jgi:hypothetical protein